MMSNIWEEGVILWLYEHMYKPLQKIHKISGIFSSCHTWWNILLKYEKNKHTEADFIQRVFRNRNSEDRKYHS